MSDLFTEKFVPQNFAEFVGNSQIVEFVKKWGAGWNSGQKGKPLLFHGSPGVGKTCLALLAAKEFDWEIFELNASDFRNKEAIERVAGGAAFNASFSGKKRLILLDEVDGIQKREDRGGFQAVAEILKNSQNPVILTANKVFFKDRKLDGLRFLCEEQKFSKISFPSIAKRMREVCEKEGIDYDQEVLKKLAENCSGDMRAALLDLQNLSILHNKITLFDVENSGFRERESDVFQTVEKIFKTKDIKAIREMRFALDLDSDMVKLWVEENLPRIYKDEDLRKGFDYLSRADIFDGRIRRRQHYGFLRYSTELATSGVSIAKEQEYHGWLKLQFPGILKTLSGSSSERGLKQVIAEKLAEKIHSSAKEIIKSDLVFFMELMKDKKFALEFAALFEFDEKELAFLLDTTPKTAKVKNL
ncbi:MAG: replication factor C large subunit, partial [Candidatus Diapherotrites archaeon]|nr:replication factor C large subunit [Candidatus Diapherotrites archaeon]